MKERKRYKFDNGPVSLLPGDKLICTVHDFRGGKSHRFEENIGREIVVDTVVTFDLDEPILGLSDGIGAIFGRAE